MVRYTTRTPAVAWVTATTAASTLPLFLEWERARQNEQWRITARKVATQRLWPVPRPLHARPLLLFAPCHRVETPSPIHQRVKPAKHKAHLNARRRSRRLSSAPCSSIGVFFRSRRGTASKSRPASRLLCASSFAFSGAWVCCWPPRHHFH